MPANDRTGHPANDNEPCARPVRAQCPRIGGIKPPGNVRAAVSANDNGVNTAAVRDNGSGRQISPQSVRDWSGVPCLCILKEVASGLRKSERWLWDWLKKHPHDRNGQPFLDWLDAPNSLLLKTSHAYQKQSYAAHSPTAAGRIRVLRKSTSILKSMPRRALRRGCRRRKVGENPGNAAAVAVKYLIFQIPVRLHTGEVVGSIPTAPTIALEVMVLLPLRPRS